MTYAWLAVCVVVGACAHPPAPTPQEGNPVSSLQSPASNFENVELGTFLKSSCSPEFTDFTTPGLMIRMPERVTVPSGGEARLPLCIAAQLTLAEVARYPHVFHPTHIVMVDDERGETFTGSLWKDRTFRPSPPPEGSPEELETETVISFYNVNVLELLEELPRRDARYQIYVMLDAHKSNVCVVEVKVE